MRGLYSADIRALAIQKLKENKTSKEISEYFKISLRTIAYWKKIYNKTGRTEPILQKDRISLKKNRSKMITDDEDFKKFVEENNSLTRKQMAEKYSEKVNKKITIDIVKGALRRIQFTFKKKLQSTKKQILKKELNI